MTSQYDGTDDTWAEKKKQRDEEALAKKNKRDEEALAKKKNSQ